MLNADLMQFKDDILKTLRELEKKIMLKVNKNQTDLSSDINIINDSIKLLRDNNNSIIESIAEQKVNIDKISEFEKILKKVNTTISGHENKISDSISEISYLRNRCERSITETLSVPGIIGKNCKFSTFNDYITYNLRDITSLKSEKDFNRRENKDLRQKLEQGLKHLTNLVDTFINRSKLYTDASKKLIIELMDNKTNELEEKNLEIISKVCKIDIDTEQKVKIIKEDMDNFLREKSEQFQKMEDKLTLMNYNFEEMAKKFHKTNEELNMLKENGNMRQNSINELKNLIKNNIGGYNLNNISLAHRNLSNKNLNINPINNLYKKKFHLSSKIVGGYKNDESNGFDINNFGQNNNNSSNKLAYSPNNKLAHSPSNKLSKKNKISLLLGDNNFNQKTNNINQINNSPTKKNSPNNINEKENKDIMKDNFIKSNQKIFEENSFTSEEESQIDDKEEKIKDILNKNIETLDETSNNESISKINPKRSIRKKTIDPKKIINKSKKVVFLDINNKAPEERRNDNNIINIKRSLNLHKTFRTNKFSLNVKDTKLNSPNKKEFKIDKNKEEKIINNKKEKEKEKTINKPLILDHKINKSSEIKKNLNSFPIIRNSNSQHSYEKNQKLEEIKNNIISNNNLFEIFSENNIKKNLPNKRNRQMSIDIDTGIGCNVIKLSLNNNLMTPYNTNGLLTIASKKYLNKHLIKIEDSTPLDDVYLFNNINNLYQTYRSHSNSLHKKQLNNIKAAQMILNNSPKNKEKEASKATNISNAYNYGEVKFHHLNKNKK